MKASAEITVLREISSGRKSDSGYLFENIATVRNKKAPQDKLKGLK
jgi:hypothetical protein